MVQKMEPKHEQKQMQSYAFLSASTAWRRPADTIIIDGTQIDFTDNYKDLGILVSNTLDWSKHYSTICSKAYGL